MVTDGGSRFREGLPAANICNLVHKAPTFVVVSLDRERPAQHPAFANGIGSLIDQKFRIVFQRA